jgi:hypothetical protein
VTLGRFTHADGAGANTLHFTGRVGGRKLAPASYTLSAVATLVGHSSSAATAHFRITG